MNKLFTKVATLSIGLAMAIGVGVAVGSRGAKQTNATSPATLDLSSKTWTDGTNKVIWSITDGSTAVATMESSGTNYRNYLGGDENKRTSSRFYSGGTVTITPASGITLGTITFTATTDNYATVFKNSTWTNASASVSSSTVTITPTSGTTAITAKPGGTCGFTAASFAYTSGGGTTTYTVSYDANGGSGSAPASQTSYNSGATVTVLANTFTAPSGKEFDKWNTAADGGGTSYDANDTFSIGANTTLYAQWKDTSPSSGEYTLTLNSTSLSLGSSGYFSGNKTVAATGPNNASMNVSLTLSNVMKSTAQGHSGDLQFRNTPGYLYNTTDLGTVKSVTISSNSGCVYYIGSAQNPTSSGSGGYFRVARSSGTAYATEITIVFEVGGGGQTNPSISFTNSSAVALAIPGTTSATRTVSYANLTGSLSVTSVNSNVCTAALAENPSTGDAETGTIVLTITAAGSGSTTVTVSSEDDEVSASLTVNVSESKTYNKASKLSHVVDGQEIILVCDDAAETTKYAMSTGQGSSAKNRGIANVTISNDSVTTSSTDVAKIRINKVGNYYTLYDKTNNGYYYGCTGSNNELYIGSTVSGDLYYWQLSFETTNNYTYTKLVCKGSTGAKFIQFYHDTQASPVHRFSTYNTNQKKVSMFILSSDFPTETPLGTISGNSSANVFIGGSVIYSGSYTPTNATESIVTATLPTGITISAISMSNGSFSVTINADSSMSAGAVNVTFKPEKTVISQNLVLSLNVVSYTATHTRCDSTDDLISGMHVVIANTENEVVAGTQNANNISGTAALFDKTNNTLANSLGTEYILYETTLGSGSSDPTGWVFYNNGKYLRAAGSGNNNYLQASDQLDQYCLFTISFGNNGSASISTTAANGLMGYMSGVTNLFSCYSSAKGSIELYYRNSDMLISNAQLQASAFESAFLFLDGTIPTTDESDTGNCRTKHYYAYAKIQYLLLDDSDLLSQNAIRRLEDWATANQEAFDSSTKSFTSNASQAILKSISEGSNSATIIIIVASIVSLTAIGGYFLFKKKKQN